MKIGDYIRSAGKWGVVTKIGDRGRFCMKTLCCGAEEFGENRFVSERVKTADAPALGGRGYFRGSTVEGLQFVPDDDRIPTFFSMLEDAG